MVAAYNSQKKEEKWLNNENYLLVTTLFSTIATYWSEHLSYQITAVDVAAMMALLKVARLKSNVGNEDNWVDACGYLACGGELACGDR